jgi:hypothetical protein
LSAFAGEFRSATPTSADINAAGTFIFILLCVEQFA